MNAKNLFKLGVIGLYGMATLALSTLDISPAAAHGERSQEPFLRMRTIQWYDMKWGPETTKVNDFATMTGKFHLAEDWPRAVGKPGRAFFNVGSPSRSKSAGTTPLKSSSKRGFRDVTTCTPWSTSRMRVLSPDRPPG